VKLTKRNAIAVSCILVVVFVGLQVLRHRHDERPLYVFQEIGATGYPEESSTGMGVIRIEPMELPIGSRSASSIGRSTPIITV